MTEGTEESAATPSRQISQITVTLGGGDVKATTDKPSTVSLEKSSVKSQPPARPAMSWKQNTQDNEPINKPVSARKACWDQKATHSAHKPVVMRNVAPNHTPSRPMSVNFPVQHKSPDKSEDELTQKPVSTRKAVWEQKVAQADKEREEAAQAARLLRTSPNKSPHPLRATSATGLAQRSARVQGRSSNKDITSPLKSPEKVSVITNPTVSFLSFFFTIVMGKEGNLSILKNN